MLITVMFLVVAVKSRTFSSFLYSANEHIRVQELGGHIVSQLAELANGNIPYRSHHTQFMNGA